MWRGRQRTSHQSTRKEMEWLHWHDTGTPQLVQADRASSRCGAEGSPMSKGRTLHARVLGMAVHQGAPAGCKELTRAEQRLWGRTVSGRGTWLCPLQRSPPACLACLQHTETFFFFLCEICCSTLPLQLLLFIGTGSGRPGRNYLSLGHAWCLAEHTVSLLHGSC